MLSTVETMSRVKAVEEKLQVESSDQIIEHFTHDQLTNAADLFIYLVMCPDTIKPWIGLYKDLFQTQSPDQILLTLNRIMKGTKTPKDLYLNNLAENLFVKLKNMFPPLQILEGKVMHFLLLTYLRITLALHRDDMSIYL